MFDLFDLPTHLPGETPTSLPKEEPELEPIPQDQTIEETNEEGQSQSQSQSPTKSIFIPGTSIKLETEEDVAKWIEERKKNWPTSKNIALKLKENEEKKKRKLEDTNSIKKRPKVICKFYQQFRKCKYGSKCRNVHQLSNEPNPIALIFNDQTHYRKFINGIPILIPKLYSNRVENTNVNKCSLFKHLVAQDQMINENKLVIEFIQYLNDKGLINEDIMKEAS
ncbi:unnamed protein product [Candida verbasci]|uniref:C3H1-type domain-containing protein n=1 Tax=Candida verbasci TaxID=1227364 RepID=A0A9W4TWS6_9ASCO|nr:unnamed protein product [Candida verbasci]